MKREDKEYFAAIGTMILVTAISLTIIIALIFNL